MKIIIGLIALGVTARLVTARYDDVNDAAGGFLLSLVTAGIAVWGILF